ncbi:hypothetical protein BRUM_1473 [Bifidobacterium ruminantium]|uniref:Zinc-ribbon domain-containing protein n=1 Tax=Bifidobacterium ruminantium TaxID=78346 RepID=A0A087CRY4_BIFRU|nr:hypothetical protein BRUM_1473 [Bifidobacterium ruminantium]
MKYCTQCGNQAADNAKFCESCGTPFAAVQSASAAPSGNLPPMPSNRSAVPLPQPSGNVAPPVSAAPIQPPMPIPAAAGQPMGPAKKKKVIIAVVAVVVVLALAFVGIGVMTARANSMKLAGSSFFAKVDDKDEEITVSVGQDNTVTLSARDTYYDETTKIVGTLGKGSIDGDSVSYPVANLKIYRDGKDVSWSDLFSMSESEAKKTQSMTSVMLTAPKNAAKGNMVGTWGVSLNVGVFSYKIEAVAYQGGSWSGKMSGAGMDAETFGGTWASQGDGSYHIHETQTYDSEFDVTLPSAR